MKINSPQSTFVRHSLLLCCWQCRVSQLCTGKTFLRFHCSSGYANAPNYYVVDCVWNAMAHAQKPDFVFSAKRTSPFKSAGSSVQSTPGSRGVRISGSNAGYTMYRGRVKSTGYPLHSPVSLSLPLPCAPCDITFRLDSTYIARLFSKCSLHTAPISSHLFANRNTRTICCGPGSSVGIATDYGLDGPGSNSSGDEISTRPERPWGPPNLL